MTLLATDDFTAGNTVSVNSNGNTVTISTSDDITFGNNFVGTINWQAGDTFNVGNGATITGNITAGDDINIGNNVTLSGNMTSGDDISVGNNGNITGNVVAADELTLPANTFVTGNCTPTHSQCTGGTPAVIAEYRFDECSWTSGTSGAVIDSTGSYSGTPYSTNTVSGGVVNRAADLSATGTSDYIHWPISLLNGRTNFTISLWFKTSSHPDQQEILHGLGSSSGDDEIEIYLINTTGIRVNIRDEGNNYTAPSSFTNGAWHHLAVTRSGASVCVYLDSTVLACNTRSSNALSITDSNALLTGQEQDSFGGGFTSSQALEAQLDEFKVFAAALSASSISSIYANELAGNNWDGSSRSNPCLITSMAEYRFDEASWNGTSGEVADSSGNGYAGTAASLSATKPTTADTTPAIAGNPGTCRYGVFTRANKDYVALPASFPNLGSTGQAFTITAWLRTTNNTQPGQRILIDDQSNSTGYGFSLGDGGTGRLRFYSRGTPSRLILDTDNVNVIANNTWYFVAAVIDVPNKIKRIYAFNSAGTLLTSVSSAAWTEASFGSDSGIASIGGETNASGENSSSFGFSGNLDEVNVFTSALSQSDLATILARTHPCTATVNLDHIRLEHDGAGLTCMPETITVKACAVADCTSYYTDTVTATLSPSGWVGGDAITFSSGTTTAQLRHTTAETVTLGGSVTSPGATNSTRCFNGGTESCSLPFSNAGFIIAAPDLIANKPGTVTIQAVKLADNGITCAPAFTGSRTVNFWSGYENPNTGTKQVSLGGTPISTSTSGTGISLNFNATATASIAVSYADAGQMRLNASYTESGTEAGLVLEGNDLFVSRPAGLCVFSGDTDAACPSNDHTCSVFKKAGEDFNLTVRGVAWEVDSDTDMCSDNVVTPNYRQVGIALGHSLVAPSGGSGGSLGLTTLNLAAADNGSNTVTQTISEVGVFRFTATPPTNGYFTTYTVPAGTSASIGRFIPDHFAISPSGINEGCVAGNFTYFGQDGFSTAFTITAQNTGNATTANYTGNFAKLGLTDWNNFVFTATGLPTSPLSILAASASTLPSGSWANGVAAVVAKHQASRPTSPVAPASVMVSAKPVDSDSVTPASATAVQSASTALRYGRAVVQNAYGPERETHKMRLLTQYYNGSSFINNSDDSCTIYNAASLTCNNLTGPIACSDVTPSGTGIGHGQYFLLTPLSTKIGPLLYTLTVTPWLQYEWDNAGNDYDENPFARANFGIYRGNDRIINWREIIR